MGDKALKKENQKLRVEVQKLSDELKNLQESFNSIRNAGKLALPDKSTMQKVKPALVSSF